jgi:hypothetical protein
MSQSMNGMSFYGNGISETDNIICNNLACNNISSNGILTNTLTSQQITTTALSATNLTGTSATLSGLITGQNIHCKDGFIVCYNGDIVADSGNLRGKSLDLSGQILTIDIVENLKGLTKNVQNELSSLLESCLGSITTGVRNYALGEYCMPALSSGSYNLGIGTDTLTSLLSGSSNIAIGRTAGLTIKSGNNNISLGRNSGQDPAYSNLTINNSIAIGTNSLFYDSNQIILGTANETTIIKGQLECLNDIHCQNLYIDYGGGVFLDYTILANLQGLTYNVQNTFNTILKDCGSSITSGIKNVFFGTLTLPYLTTGDENVGIGNEAGLNLINGSRNIFVGTYSGQYVRGNDNICLGSQSGQDSDPAYSNLVLNNSIAIGKNAVFYESDQIMLGSALHETVILGTLDVKQTAKFTEAVVCSKVPTIGSHLTNKTFVESYMNSVASFLTPYSSFNALVTTVSSLSSSLAKNKNGVFIPSPNTNGQKTVVFPTPYPVGSVVTLITSLEFTGGVIGTIQVSSITNASFKYDIFSTSSTRIESFVTVHWLAMIQ